MNDQNNQSFSTVITDDLVNIKSNYSNNNNILEPISDD
jgi:hypothetical protein